MAYNCAPAISADGSSVYVAVNNNGYLPNGYLCKLNASDLSRQLSVALKDPQDPGMNAWISDDGTSSPTVGPNGDVFYGVLEGNFPSHHARGWLLHFNANLAAKIPGSFGWDDTASIVLSSAVPSYTGSSSYLVLTKYNNYIQYGDGQNKLAILDPFASQPDPILPAVAVMQEVLTVLGPTPDPGTAASGSGASIRPRSTSRTSARW